MDLTLPNHLVLMCQLALVLANLKLSVLYIGRLLYTTILHQQIYVKTPLLQHSLVVTVLLVSVDESRSFSVHGAELKGRESGNVVHYAPTERPIISHDYDYDNNLEFKGPEAKIGRLYATLFCCVRLL